MAESTSKLSILVQLRDEASNAMRSLSNSLQDLGGDLGFAGDKSGILAGSLAAIGGATIWKGINAFAEAEAQMAKFDALVKSMPPGLQKFRDAMVEAGNKAERLGFDGENSALNLAKLLKATGDWTFSQKAFQAAMDLSRLKGISLDDSTQALILAFQGGGRILKQLGIDVDDHASKQTILEAVLRATAGQAEAYAGTWKGMMDIIKTSGGNILEGIGEPFVKSAEKMFVWIGGGQVLTQKIQEMTPVWNALGLSIGAVSTVLAIKAVPALLSTIAGWLGLTEAITVAGAGLMASLGVWLAVIAVLALVIYTVRELIVHWAEVKDGLRIYWEEIKAKAIEIWNSIVAYFKELPFHIGEIFGEFVMKIVTAIKTLWDYLKGAIPAMVDSIVQWFKDLPGRVASAIASLPDKLYQTFQSGIGSVRTLISDLLNYIANAPGSIVDFGKNALNKMVDTLNGFINGFNSKVPGFMQLPNIPKFAEGGIVTRPTLGIIGEAGPEAVVPLSRLGMAGGGGINITLQGDFYTTSEVAEKFANEIARLVRYQIKL